MKDLIERLKAEIQYYHDILSNQPEADCDGLRRTMELHEDCLALFDELGKEQP